jgi:hypothetical protein
MVLLGGWIGMDGDTVELLLDCDRVQYLTFDTAGREIDCGVNGDMMALLLDACGKLNDCAVNWKRRAQQHDDSTADQDRRG